MKELDVLLARYLDRYFCSASNREQDAFRRLLETEDTILHAYCLGSERPPPEFAVLIERITAYPGSNRGLSSDCNPPAGRSPSRDQNPAPDRKPGGRRC
jgi:succinate dehydrogenase flavin-adding protein (antitoxin of CptAB toxin-antitoxin module)